VAGFERCAASRTWSRARVTAFSSKRWPGSLDEAAAMLSQLLEKHGIGARVVPSEAVSVANLPRLDVTGVQMACLSYLEPGSFTNAATSSGGYDAGCRRPRSSTGSGR
jgi:hypothetical protein